MQDLIDIFPREIFPDFSEMLRGASFVLPTDGPNPNRGFRSVETIIRAADKNGKEYVKPRHHHVMTMELGDKSYPHNSSAECARRKRQIASGTLHV